MLDYFIHKKLKIRSKYAKNYKRKEARNKKTADSLRKEIGKIQRETNKFKKIISAFTPEITELRINLAMKGSFTEGTILDSIYDEGNESGIYGILIKAYNFLSSSKENFLYYRDKLAQNDYSKNQNITKLINKIKYNMKWMEEKPDGVKFSFATKCSISIWKIPYF